MTAYELSEKLNDAVNKNEKHLTLDIQAMLMLREQADRIEHYKDKAEYLDKRELELLEKIRKYEEVLHAIANDYPELSDHKIEVQVRNHKKWAREALE